METINSLLDTAKQKIEPQSDYQLAKELGLTRSGISHARKRNRLSNHSAAVLAKLIERDKDELIAIANYWREEPENRDTWERISKLVTSAAAGFMLLFLIPNSNVQTMELDLTNKASNNHYAQLKRRVKKIVKALQNLTDSIIPTTTKEGLCCAI